MVTNESRKDPYKNFNFRVVAVAAIVGVATFVIAKKLSSTRSDSGSVRRNAYRRLFGLDLGSG